MALARRASEGELLHHADHGCSYTSLEFTNRLHDWNVAASCGTVGDCFDNAAMEINVGDAQEGDPPHLGAVGAAREPPAPRDPVRMHRRLLQPPATPACLDRRTLPRPMHSPECSVTHRTRVQDRASTPVRGDRGTRTGGGRCSRCAGGQCRHQDRLRSGNRHLSRRSCLCRRVGIEQQWPKRLCLEDSSAWDSEQNGEGFPDAQRNSASNHNQTEHRMWRQRREVALHV